MCGNAELVPNTSADQNEMLTLIPLAVLYSSQKCVHAFFNTAVLKEKRLKIELSTGLMCVLHIEQPSKLFNTGMGINVSKDTLVMTTELQYL